MGIYHLSPCSYVSWNFLSDYGLTFLYLIICGLYFFSHKSIVVVADQSVISWGSFPTYGELVCSSVDYCHL